MSSIETLLGSLVCAYADDSLEGDARYSVAYDKILERDKKFVRALKHVLRCIEEGYIGDAWIDTKSVLKQIGEDI